MKRAKGIRNIILGIVFILIGIFAINWIMTFRLEDTLRRKLRSEVIKATDGFYDCNFDNLTVGFFTGELRLSGLSFFPDSASLMAKRVDSLLPPIFIDVRIDTLDFKGVNLTWKFSYSKLSFEEFLVQKPAIKIYSPKKELRVKVDSLDDTKSFYESVSSLFDVIHARYISLKDAEILYEVEDLGTVSYMLKDFDFRAYNFQLDEHSQERGLLMFSDDFVFKTITEQPIFESDKFRFDIGGIELSTIDSIVHVSEAHFRSKEEYWANKKDISGSRSNIEVGDFRIDGIHFDRTGSYNFLTSRKLYVNNPAIEHFVIRDKEKVKNPIAKIDSTQTELWSLYAVTQPIFERITIEEIDIEKAYFKYVITEKGESDEYLLNRLDFKAYGFVVDSLHQDDNVMSYVEDFDLEATAIKGNLPTKNTQASVESFKLSSIEKLLKLSKIQFSPISLIPHKEHLHGEVEEFEVRNIRYDEGVDADLIYIESPKVEYISSAISKAQKKAEEVKENDIAGTIQKFINHLSVDNIIISNGNASFIDRKTDNKYTFRNLDFSVKNFFVDSNVRFFKDYIFRWDQYKIKFKDFDNLTPDKSYRVKIGEGDLNSILGSILIKDLEIIPSDTMRNSFVKVEVPYANLTGIDQEKIKQKQIHFKTFSLEKPVVEYVDKKEQNTENYSGESSGLWWNQLQFDSLHISSPSLSYRGVVDHSYAKFKAINLVVDSFEWSVNKFLKVNSIDLNSPDISIIENKGIKKIDGKHTGSTFPACLGSVAINEVKIDRASMHSNKLLSEQIFRVEFYKQRGFRWKVEKDSLLQIAEVSIINPSLKWISQPKDESGEKKEKSIFFQDIAEIDLGRFNLSNLNWEQYQASITEPILKNKLNETSFSLEQFNYKLRTNSFDAKDIAFTTKDFSYPTSEYYTLHFDKIDFSKKKGILELDKIKLIPAYPKFEFAYKHPRGADWFQADIGNIRFSGIDLSSYKKDSVVRIRNLDVDHVLLQNLKNQKIEIEHNVMPLFYEQFQRFPVKYRIDDVAFKDFTIIYEELPKKGFNPLSIPFSSMNFTTNNFTNLQEGKGDFYTFDVEGIALGTAPFTGKWTMPVDTINDKFFFSVDIRNLDLRSLNQIITPGAPAYVKKGYADRLCLNTEASSKGAAVDLIFEYDDLDVVLLKHLGDSVENKMLSGVINRWVIENKNKGKNMRVIHDTIVRDPYHSNFNYFWQMLKPTIVESVGVTERKQNVLHNLEVLLKKAKAVFKRKNKDKK